MNYVIGSRVRRAREAAGLTQEAMAGLTDRSKEAISNIERGVNLPTIDTLQRICDSTNVPISFMFEQVGPSPEHSDLKAKIDTLITRLDTNEMRMMIDMLELYLNRKSKGTK
ncbi:helix-turn-helix transcriptional regulator [uncultured Methylobacterium sp.]|uniref:helix-turn-helix domain-containing protein n=1 Tax=uncultured Methylobacterium sp. TaxID=157278 RepID=UPI00261DDB4B|nr:helix-turn-helix transcriptional regulator [uncultured Methylobacterium sp.]